MRALPRSPRLRGDERGASLILAMVFVFAIGLSLVAILNFAGASSTTSINLHDQRTLEAQATSSMTAAVQWARYEYLSPAPAPTACLPVSAGALPDAVYCSGSEFPGASATRVVQLWACPGAEQATPPASCAGPTSPAVLVAAQVTYDDIPPGAALLNCSLLNSCGYTTTIDYWDVRTADR